MYRVPIATYRIQFNSGFTLQQARRIVGYLADLGISDIYASPVLRARKGSQHGYDVVDATQINPELGTESDFDALHTDLHARGMGFVLDIVPNHMAASPENGWWTSVLENGPHSRFFHYFDIDWRGNKVVLPILGKPYGDAVEAKEIQLGYDTDGLHFRYYDTRLPLSPRSYVRVLEGAVETLPEQGVGIELRELVKPPSGASGEQSTMLNSRFLKETLRRLYETDGEFRTALDDAIARINGESGNAESFNTLDELLDAQWYRLAYWRIASEKINYRRFFDVADLVGIRVENPEVFEARHRKIFELVTKGQVTGLRIDHIDGLLDPVGHLRKLQLRLEEPFYVVVEKILAHDEELPRDFAVSGTTGYDFLDTLNALFVDAEGLGSLTKFYRDFTGITQSFEDLCYEKKKRVISELFSGEMAALGDRLATLAALDRNARDFAPSELLAALTEITASMHVYRSYVREPNVTEGDRDFITRAIDEGRRRAGTSVDDRIFTFLRLVLLVDPPSYIASERDNWLAFVMRWQQFTGRVMAKGVEDTAFYNYNRLVSLNEVGGEPGRGDFDPLEDFHARNERIAAAWPHTMNATSTHDTKRSEDVRARISVLSELATAWERDVKRWSRMNAPLRADGVPDPNEELLLYQTLIGMWPVEEDELDTVPERLRQYLEKASREAKKHTSWITPDTEWEQKFFTFADAVLKNETFLTSFLRVQKRVGFHGYLNALAQLVLKLTAPGSPDFYQGTELWDFSLVDPDNRRPVDYERRQVVLRKLQASDSRGTLDLKTLLRRWFDGRVKMFATWRGLAVRARNEKVFRDGDYRALRDASPNVCAFLRGEQVLVAVPRLTTQIVKPPEQPLGEAVWGDATLETGLAARWRNAFTGAEIEGKSLRLAEVFADFPVAILELSPRA